MFKLIFNLLLLGASAGIFFLPTYGISAKYADVQAKQAEIKEYENANKSARELVGKRDELLSKDQAISPEEHARLITFLPDNIDPIRFILEMEGIGKKIGMPIKNARYSSVKAVAAPEQAAGSSDVKYGIFTFIFTTEGSYDDLQKMLKEFDRSLRLIDIETISFTQAGTSSTQAGAPSATDHYIYTVTLKTYWLK
jgi:hypothetical protein